MTLYRTKSIIFQLSEFNNKYYMSFSCPMAYQVVLDTPDFKPKWTAAVEWLNDELERVSYI